MGSRNNLKGTKGTVAWESPSNIALIKYWGKHGRQLPRNASVSFTLSEAKSRTRCDYEFLDQPNKQCTISFLFEGKENAKFQNRIQKYLNSLFDEIPMLALLKLHIESENTFPHSSGIASSASAMSALALCLVEIENISKEQSNPDSFLQRASHIARLGSGSAARSVYPQLALWGAYSKDSNASDKYAIPYSKGIHSMFLDYHDDILIVSKSEKSVSSSAGHQLMENNPFAPIRYQNAEENLTQLLHAMSGGDVDRFIDIVEKEALQLHALMMCSQPSYILMEPNTLNIIREIRQFRKESKIPLCFTLDAGPNVHVLYPKEYQLQTQAFIKDVLSPFTEDGMIIKDLVGEGPKAWVQPQG